MEKQKTSSKRKAAIKVIVAVLLIAIMTGISFAVANFVHNRKSVQASSVKNGLSAYELAVQQGYAGSLDDWLVSLQGKSAYQIAVDNGYSGSEKDWSKTLTAMSKKDKSDISSAAFSEKGDLVITLSDGTKINVGKAVGASGKDGKDGKDGIGIKSAKINDKGELVISYSDGNSVNLDKVVGETVNNGVGIASSIINEKGELVLTYTNGETANLGGVVGKDGRDGKNGADGKDGRDGTDGTSGTDGISISAAVINESGELVISYSDGTTANLGKIVGSDGINGVNGTNGTDGKDGISVSSAEINSEGELVLSFSNGQRANVGAVVGAKGEKGDKGERGLQGAKGEKGEKGENGLNGSDGIGVKKSEINSAGELVITYTNDLTENLGPVVGAKGDKGDKGDQGVQGEKGEKGERGVQGEKGDAGLNGTDGKDGTGINNIEISNDGNLLITLTNGTSLNLGNIKGAKGDQGIQGEKGDSGLNGADGKDGTNGTDGIGVASSEINALGELVITYSDGNTVNLGKVVGNDGAQGVQGEKGDKGDQGIQGEKGDKGDQGIQGEKGDQGVQGEKGDAGINGTDGINGTNGADGVGITDVTINADNELVLSFSNGNVINLGNIKGSKGDKGDKGDKGEQGQQGLQGSKGADGLGIAKMSFNSNGELIVEYTDNTRDNLGKISDSTSENIDVNFVYHYEDSGYEVMASDVGKGQKVLAIPRTYKGYPITGLGSISSPGFGKCYDLIQITIPSNIVMLNNASGGMFGYCSKLREEGIIFEGEFTTWKDVNTYNTNNNNDTKLYYKNTDGTYTFANYTSIEFGKGAEYALYFDDENELKKALLGKAYYVVAVPVKKTYDPNAENLYVCREKNGLACTYIKETKKG